MSIQPLSIPPLPQLFPELNLQPSSLLQVPMLRWTSRVDYIEAVTVGDSKRTIHRIVKNNKWGLLAWTHRQVMSTASIIVPCQYDYIFIDDEHTIRTLKDGEQKTIQI